MILKKNEFLIITTLLIFFSGIIYSLYIEKRNNYENSNDSMFALYIDDEKAKELPEKGSNYVLDEEKSKCNNNVRITFDTTLWYAIIDYTNYDNTNNERTSCNLYFKKEEEDNAVKTIETLASLADPSSTDVYTVPDKTGDSCTYTLAYDGTTDNNLRYVGTNPCNYVTFNGEKASWRIVGVINTLEGKRLKLVKVDSIGNYSWDNKASGTGSSKSQYGSNDWSDSALKDMLNSGAYYNRTSGTCPSGKNGATTSCTFASNGLLEDARAMIDTITWTLGGTASFDSVDTGLSKHFYDYERGSTVYSNRPTTWQGKIGLLYPSDYGYATSGGSTTNRTSCLNLVLANWDNYSSSDCKNNDWLSSSSTQWAMTPNSANTYNVFRLISSGYIGSGGAFNALAVRPTLYLSHSIKITNGDGSKASPYELSF